MKILKSTILLFLFTSALTIIVQAHDWADLNHYNDSNEEIGLSADNENRIVFMGNSITQFWSDVHPAFFADKPFINKGISGQTTSQMLARFDADVIKQKPYIVVFLGGTNDIAQNGGPVTIEQIMNNISSMAQMAKTSGIQVVLCSVLPVYQYNWRPDIEPIEQIITLNALIKKYTEDNDMVYADFYSPLVNEEKGLKSAYSNDGVHPNLAGYLVMEPIVEEAIQRATTPATGIAISPSTLSMADNSTSQLTLTVTPEGASRNAIWSSSNTSVATVSLSGLVRALSPGEVTITATNPEGNLTATCVVTITNSGNPYIYQTGTAYRWSQNANSTSNANRVLAPGLNDGDITTDISLDGANGGEPVSNGYEAAGLIFSSLKTISKVEFINGTFRGIVNNVMDDGCFDADMKLQTSVDGTTWTDATGWSVSPDYEYMNTSVSGTTFTFTGSASDILGIRVTGKVRTSEITGSWEARVREISAFSTQITDVFDISNESEISVFPNPLSTGSLSIILPDGANRLSIADISGRIIFQTRVNKKDYLIDHSVFKQNGIYMITVFTSEKSFYKKLIFSK
jgi:uncharacterized protein YjdB